MATSPATLAIGKRYILHEQLGAGGMGVVYRAVDRLTGENVALKQVTAPPRNLTFASKTDESSNLRLALAGEFKTLASLRHPNIISVLDYGFDDQRQPYFTMEYLNSAATITEAGRQEPLVEKIRLLVDMLQALVYLHRRGVLHRDLKPGNVLVVDGRVKVVDFGLSVVTKTSSAKHHTQTTSGTFAYMAPELFMGSHLSRASDLYAVGVIAHELFAGRHPFSVDNMAMLINEILNKPVDVWSLGLPEGVAKVLGRLLAKTDMERYTDASEVIRDLCLAANLSMPQETVDIRESFLQAAKFVARETELEQLAEVLGTVLMGHGAAWLVGGESGVGKSRLLEELRTLALVKGALVLRGQGVSTGGTAYQLWRDILRWLCLLTDLDDHEAGVLGTVLPDVSELLGRDVADLAPLDPQATQNRLLTVVIELFRRQKQPIVLMLEDLQWAGSESLAMLKRLNTIIAELPLLILGSYRDDERPDLPDSLPEMQIFRLKRLTETGIADLSGAMLGDAGRDPQVISLLERETEGNIFFLVEVMRVLTEEAGQLDQIALMTLPQKVFAGGVQQVMQRRLGQLPEDAHSLLRLAAVAGRELDMRVLRALEPTVDLDSWVASCVSAAVLDVQENRWRFAHDKLREGALVNIAKDELPKLHLRVAEALEATYPDAPEKAATLAYHYGMAEDIEKELHYAELAGQQKLNNNAYVEGIRFLQRALELLMTHNDNRKRAGHELRLQLLIGPALMNYYGHSHPIVGQTYARAAQLGRETQQVNEVFRVLWGLWANSAIRGDYTSARLVVKEMFDTAGKTGDAFHRLEAYHVGWSSAIWEGATRTAEDYFQEGIPLYDRAQHQQACISMHGHDTGVCGSSLGTMNLWLYGYPDQALQRARDCYQRAIESDHTFTRTYGLFAQSIMGYFNRDVKQLEEWTEAFLNFSSKYGFKFHMTLAGITHGWYLAQTGRYQDALQQLEKTTVIMHQAKTYMGRPLMVGTFMNVSLMAGQIDEGIGIFRKELEEHPLTGERIMEPEIRRLYGELLLRQNDVQQAEEEFQLALTIARQQEARSLELRAGMSLARLWQQQNKVPEAHDMLTTIYDWFTEGFGTADLKEAKVLLEELSL